MGFSSGSESSASRGIHASAVLAPKAESTMPTGSLSAWLRSRPKR